MSTCTREECDRPTKARGLCRTHYSQWQKTGETWVIGTNPRRKRNLCTFPECGKRVTAYGLCAGHDRQRRVGQELRPLRQARPTAADGYAWCSTCKTFQPVEHFSWDKTRNQPKRVCLDCHAAAVKRARQRPGYQRSRRAYNLKRNYGIEPEAYEVLFKLQEGRCQICREPIINLLEHDGDGREAAHVDHCHTTGKIRGLLCPGCNVGLGYFAENPDRLAAAIEYVRRHNG